ncbi:MAG: hypothetical protein WBW81_03990, partial [Methylocella sp.]
MQKVGETVVGELAVSRSVEISSSTPAQGRAHPFAAGLIFFGDTRPTIPNVLSDGRHDERERFSAHSNTATNTFEDCRAMRATRRVGKLVCVPPALINLISIDLKRHKPGMRKCRRHVVSSPLQQRLPKLDHVKRIYQISEGKFLNPID